MKNLTRSGMFRWVGALCALAALAQGVNTQTVRLHGSVSLEKRFTQQKPALESQTGVKLEIVGNGAGRGLVDLSNGRADIAMIGGTLDKEVELPMQLVVKGEPAGDVKKVVDAAKAMIK